MPSQISENTKPEHSQGEGLASHRVNLASFPPGPHIGMQPVIISKPQSTCGKIANQPSISQAVTESNLALSFLGSNGENS